ncbi:MAG: EpsG family protein, partial [Lachnospiraceae bacterium]|nr:EpsG family protein [Lachnospiraceae bacterium]
MIYLGCFLLSLGFAHCACKYSKQRSAFFVFAFLSILIPALLGGLRDYSIGTDTRFYAVPDFVGVKYAKGFFNFVFNNSEREPLYLTLCFFSAKILGGGTWNQASFFLFMMQFITIACVWYGAYKHRKYVSVTLVLTLFFCFHYNATYNVMRQYLASAIIFAGLHNIDERRYKRFLLIIVIACLFHSTAVMGLVLLPVKWYLDNHKNTDSSKMLFRQIFIVCGIMIGAYLIPQICLRLINIGILESRYIYYFTHESITDSKLDTVLYAGEIILLLLLGLRGKRQSEFDFNFYKTNLIILFAVLQLGKIIYSGERFGMLFSMINLIMLAYIPNFFEKKSRKIVTIGIILIGMVYWIYIYMYSG